MNSAPAFSMIILLLTLVKHRDMLQAPFEDVEKHGVSLLLRLRLWISQNFAQEQERT